jgi:RNA polymerase sigma-70 factor, ECF subfamily
MGRVDDLERLAAAAVDGDPLAAAALVRATQSDVWRLCAALGDRQSADDLTQETYLRAFGSLHRFEGRSSLRTWIFQILLNIARTRGVREKRTLPFSYFKRRAEEGRDEPAVDADRFQGRDGVRPGWWARPPAEWEGADVRLENDEVRDLLLKAIGDLPPRQRDVIVLRDLQGYSSEEARNVLGLTETNQRVLLHRARSKVRSALESYFDAEVTA